MLKARKVLTPGPGQKRQRRGARKVTAGWVTTGVSIRRQFSKR
jgi:hypothetical protein